MMNDEQHQDYLEEFFRENLEKHSIPFDEADWEALESRLDMLDAKQAVVKWKYATAAVLALFLGLLGYISLQYYSPNGTPPQQQAMQQQAPVQSGDARESAPANNNPATNESGPNDNSLANRSREWSPEGSTTSDKKDGAADEDLYAGTDTENMQLAVSREQSANLYIDELNCENCWLKQAELVGKPLTMADRIAEASVPTEAAGKNNTAASHLALAKTAPVRSPQFRIGIVASPDFSTAGGFTNFEGAGYKFGVLASMQVSPRLTLRSGVLHSNVRYRAGRKDYHPPGGYWPSGVAADQTFAECLILDIPLTLMYDIARFDNARLSVGAGLSSYIMLSEDYRFEYTEYQPNGADQWSADTGTAHWFSNVNISIGYELDIHSLWSLQVEPFVQLPVRDVGWGNVKLYSMGSFVSVNYHLK